MHVRLLAWVWLVVGRLPWVLLVVWRPLTRLLMVRQLTRVLVLVLGRLLWVALLIIALMRIALLTVAAAAALHRSVPPCAPRRRRALVWGQTRTMFANVVPNSKQSIHSATRSSGILLLQQQRSLIVQARKSSVLPTSESTHRRRDPGSQRSESDHCHILASGGQARPLRPAA